MLYAFARLFYMSTECVLRVKAFVVTLDRIFYPKLCKDCTAKS